jgi:serine phosphatase RsbU (regulator of sigma subunit)/Tfp pilus assembly protein PilF
LRNLAFITKARKKYETAKTFFEKMLEISKANSLKDYEEQAWSNLAFVYYYQGLYKEAQPYFIKNAEIRMQMGDSIGAAMSYNNTGITHDILGNPAEALKFYFKALKIYEKVKHYEYLFGSYQNVGLVLSSQKRYDEAIKYFNEALQYSDSIKKKVVIADAYNNMGMIYDNNQDYETAEKYFRKSLKIYAENNNEAGIYKSYNNLAVNYQLRKMYPQSLEYFMKTLPYKEKSGNYASLAITQISIGSLYNEMKNYSQAISFLDKGIKNARISGYRMYVKDAYRSLYKSYKGLGNYEKSVYYLENYSYLSDSLLNEETSEIVAEMQTKYDTEKKEQEILLQKEQIHREQAENKAKTLEINEKDARDAKRQMQLLLAIIGFILVLALAVVMIRSYLHKKKANTILWHQNEQIRQQKEEIEAQRDEIEAQRDLATQQRDLIMEQKQEITDSIQYAYRIQSAVIPDADFISEIIKEHFVFYLPRNIVSGDFYWIGKENGKVIIIAADCTGHGVPGAFMSMLGVALLNEIVNKEKITRPADILENLRRMLLDALQKRSSMHQETNIDPRQDPSLIKDGMDVVVLSIDPSLNKLEFAGANNPLYLIKNDELIEIKGNKMPVGYYLKMQEFTQHELEVSKGDKLYIFSDGYADQFGGSEGKKFKYSQFKELLTSVQNMPMAQQKETIEKTYHDWKGNLEQIDDVLVMGIKI